MKRVIHMYTYVHIEICMTRAFIWRASMRYAYARVHREQPRVPERMRYRVTHMYIHGRIPTRSRTREEKKKRAYENEGIRSGAQSNVISSRKRCPNNLENNPRFLERNLFFFFFWSQFLI